MTVKLISITPNAEEVINVAARLCKNSTGDKKIIKALIKSGHYSVLEHASATFEVKCSRACSHQLVRHRTGKFSQKSQRYVEEFSFFDNYFIPESVLEDVDIRIEYDNLMTNIFETYKAFLSYGMKKEDARYVLPNAAETEIIMTLDFRNLRNFLELRLDKHAQTEIREIAENILDIMQKEAPLCFGDIKKCEKK